MRIDASHQCVTPGELESFDCETARRRLVAAGSCLVCRERLHGHLASRAVLGGYGQALDRSSAAAPDLWSEVRRQLGGASPRPGLHL